MRSAGRLAAQLAADPHVVPDDLYKGLNSFARVQDSADWGEYCAGQLIRQDFTHQNLKARQDFSAG